VSGFDKQDSKLKENEPEHLFEKNNQQERKHAKPSKILMFIMAAFVLMLIMLAWFVMTCRKNAQ
jgi:predicted nucleic acid-binding Zn ribbon protein